MTEEKFGADLIVDSLINHEVKYIFGIPGAKIDKVFDTLVDKGPELIVARHEQNAAFMAQAVGRITGEPGVVIATSGPGASNLATGLVTATAEGDAVLALGGQVKRGDLLKRTHQSMNNAALFEPITKYSAEVKMQTLYQKLWLMPIVYQKRANQVQVSSPFPKTLLTVR
jgi:acetolactate synthase-1/2/3 large subunit